MYVGRLYEGESHGVLLLLFYVNDMHYLYRLFISRCSRYVHDVLDMFMICIICTDMFTMFLMCSRCVLFVLVCSRCSRYVHDVLDMFMMF